MKKILAFLFIFPLVLQAQFPRLSHPATGDAFLHDGGMNPASHGVARGTSMILGFRQLSDSDFKGSMDFHLNRTFFRTTYDSSFAYRGGLGFPLLRHVWLGADYDSRENLFSGGLLIRPGKFISLGAVVHDLSGPDLLCAGFALRPFNDRLTFGYAYHSSLDEDFRLEDHHSLYTADIEIRDGIFLGLAYDDQIKTTQISVAVNFSHHSAGIWKDKAETGGFVGLHSRKLRKASRGTPAVSLRLSGRYEREIVPGMINVTPMNDLLTALENFKHDTSVDILYINVRSFTMGISELTELQQCLESLSMAGKRIYTYSTGGNTATLYLTAPALKRMGYPLGEYQLAGLSSSGLFLRELLDTLGLEVEIQRIGDYKTGAEPLLLTGMSEPGKKALKEYIDQLSSELIRGISAGTGRSKDDVESLLRNGPYLIEEAQEAGILHDLIYPDEIKETIADYEDVKSIEWRSMWQYSPSRGWPYTWGPAAKTSPVAVIYATGTILEGRSRYSPLSGNRTMGDETIADRMKAARKDPRVKAIVFRVDSPGGDILASDKIHREITRITNPGTSKKGKPFIVSMGSVAASGGYYISVPADKIFAEENTLTGSIGIYGGSFTMEKFLRNRLLIHPDSVKTYPNSLFGNPFFSMTEEERAWQFKSLKNGYNRFVNHVSEGRDMTTEAVDRLGRGRIWSGKAALDSGLVDTLGTLTDAIYYAAQKVGVPIQYTSANPYPAKGYGMKPLAFGEKMLMKTLRKYPVIHKTGQSLEQELIWKENDTMIILPWIKTDVHFSSGGEVWQMLE